MYALFASNYVIPACVELLNDLETPYKNQIINDFLMSYKYGNKGQIDQILLKITDKIDRNKFREININKTIIGVWSISSAGLVCGGPEWYSILWEYAINLGDAGSIKNDVECLLKRDEREPFGTDIREGIVTLPLYLYYTKCNKQERDLFLKIFGKKRDSPMIQKIAEMIYEKGVVDECRKIIKELVDSSIRCISPLPDNDAKHMLIKWARYHEEF